MKPPWKTEKRRGAPCFVCICTTLGGQVENMLGAGGMGRSRRAFWGAENSGVLDQDGSNGRVRGGQHLDVF